MILYLSTSWKFFRAAETLVDVSNFKMSERTIFQVTSLLMSHQVTFHFKLGQALLALENFGDEKLVLFLKNFLYSISKSFLFLFFKIIVKTFHESLLSFVSLILQRICLICVRIFISEHFAHSIKLGFGIRVSFRVKFFLPSLKLIGFKLLP